MFDPMKEALRRRISFLSDEEVIGTVQNWLKTQPIFSLTELKKLVKCWNRCIEIEDDYVEK
jgi:hypothetical protein